MKRTGFLFSIIFISCLHIQAQYNSHLTASQWVDSVFKSLSPDEKIAQLMVIRAHSNLGPDHVQQVTDLIRNYNVGALCFFQGGPIRQANLTNLYQSISKTPLMVTIDAEWGLGMRLDSVTKFPYQLTLGAMDDGSLMYEMGIAVGQQCKRIGVQVNYAPVVDINNNPNNPVIGYRSFGEDKNKVTQFGLAYMKGMQDAGILACAKHFPGHGDVDVDSHLDLPVINKSLAQLDSLELKPFKALVNAGVGSVMIAHLYIPAIDTTANRATSLSKNNVTSLLRFGLGFHGLTFTDALEMKGITKYFPGGEAAVEALIAGNDMLCLPESVPDAITATKKAIGEKRLSWADIDFKLKKVLYAKYQLGLHEWKPIDTTNLVNDLNAKTDNIRFRVAKNTITVLKNGNRWKTSSTGQSKIAYVGIGSGIMGAFGTRLEADRNAEVFLFSYKDSAAKRDSILLAIRSGNFDNVVVSVSDYSLRPANNYSISDEALALFNGLQSFNSFNYIFGNVLAAKTFCSANQLVLCYQDDDITQQTAADLLAGYYPAKGHLPVTVCDFHFGSGITVSPDMVSTPSKFHEVDSIIYDALDKKAFPGCVVLAAKDGRIIYNKAFGHFTYDPLSPAVTPESIYDLASVTKISATTISVMKLYEQGKLDLGKTLGDYLPWTRGSDKAKLKLTDILMHQAGLVPFIPFYKETIDTATGIPNPAIYSEKPIAGFSTRVAENLYLRDDWKDSLFNRILKSPLGPSHKYVYSDNDFIFLGKIVEAISGMPLDQYVQKTFYEPMGLVTTGFRPRNRFTLSRIVPTEYEKKFRRQLLWGDVHDEGASMFGEVAGHAGLFSNAYDLSVLYQMLLNGGTMNGERYLKTETINYFTAYHSDISRRGLGFDKPEKDNDKRKEPYPSSLASPATFGHTGYTGTCVWVDPKNNIVYIFLSNRVNPTRENNLISDLRVRAKVQDALYRAAGN
jgi:beta-glucosidase-like glycosyl hydrolase/CubicO group peptidase (beta-lactamase class C family)